MSREWARGCIFVGRCDCGVWMDCGVSLYVVGVVRGRVVNQTRTLVTCRIVTRSV